MFLVEHVRHKRNYSFVSSEKKQELIRLVREGSTIKESAEDLDIKYSAAKAIIKLDRRVLMNSGLISMLFRQGPQPKLAKAMAKLQGKVRCFESLPTSFRSSDSMFGLKNAPRPQGKEQGGIIKTRMSDTLTESETTSVKLPKFCKLPTFVYRDEENYDKECIRQQIATISKQIKYQGTTS